MLALLDYYVINSTAESTATPVVNIVLINFDHVKFVKESTIPGHPETKTYYVQMNGDDGFHLVPSSFEDFVLNPNSKFYGKLRKK